MKFEKWTALGNDYLIVEAAALPWEPTPSRVRRLCDPHFGVGSDGILLLAPVADPAYVAELRIFNPDGSEAELSGNGAREAVMYLRRSGWTDADEFTILTKAGPITPTIRSDRECTLEMGRAAHDLGGLPGWAGGRPRGPGGRGEDMELPARLDREPAVRHRRRRGARIARPTRDRPGDRAQRSLSQPHQRELLPGGGGPGPGSHLRARGGGDALLGDRSLGRGGCSPSEWGAGRASGRVGRRRAPGRDRRGPRGPSDRLGRTRLRR